MGGYHGPRTLDLENIDPFEIRIVQVHWSIGVSKLFPKIVVPKNGRFIMENPIKMDDLVVPLFSETPIYRTQV